MEGKINEKDKTEEPIYEADYRRHRKKITEISQ